MEVRVVRRLLLIAVLLIVPATSYAQDATLSGTVKDTSGGVLPGVTVTALHEATGNTFVAVTDGVGAFRLPVRTGSYRITVELAGFATVVRSVNLLLGQTAAVDLQLSPSTVQESGTSRTATCSAEILVSPRQRTWAGNTRWRQRISDIAPCSTASGKRHTDYS